MRSCPSEPAHVAEPLHALALHLRGVDVALAVDREVVEVHELPEIGPDPAEITDDDAVAASDDMELTVRIVGGDEIALRRVGPEHRRADGSRHAFLHHLVFT